MGARKSAAESNPAGQLQTDSGGRPVVDAGGRLVFTDSKTATEQLDPAGTPPVAPTSQD